MHAELTGTMCMASIAIVTLNSQCLYGGTCEAVLSLPSDENPIIL